jgi:hypothetical protein
VLARLTFAAEARTKADMTRVAIGLRAHSGWAALVAVSGSAKALRTLMRRRIELADADIPRPVQPYHAAAKMDLELAEEFIAEFARRARQHARQSLRAAISDLSKEGFDAVACGILMGSGRPLGRLESTLAAHPLIHTAEGMLFRKALINGAADCGLRVVEVPELELLARASRALNLSPEKLRDLATELGKPIGRPWAQDEKYSALAASLALLGK